MNKTANMRLQRGRPRPGAPEACRSISENVNHSTQHLFAALALMMLGCSTPTITKEDWDNWPPRVTFEDETRETFTLISTEWISGISIKATYTGSRPFPLRLYANLYDYDGNLSESWVRVWHERVEPGQICYMNIRDFTNSVKSAKIYGRWEKED